jgi:hypothetical protein
MAHKNRFWSILPPSSSQSFVSPQVAYTNDLTLSAFATNAVEGEIGVVNVATGAIVTGITTDVCVAGVKYQLIQKRDGQVEFSPVFTTAALRRKQAYVAPVKQVRTVTATGLTIAVGDELEIMVIDETTPFMPYPTRTYHHVCTTTVLNDEIGKLRTLMNNDKYGPNQDGERLTVASGTNAAIIITGRYDFQRFSVVARGKLQGAPTTVALTTPVNFGSGSPTQVGVYNEASDVVKGIKHLYHNASHGWSQPADFGTATNFVSAGLAYITYHINSERTEVSPTPLQKHEISSSFYIFVPNSGTTPVTLLDLILGV